MAPEDFWSGPDAAVLAEAVQQWFEFYDVDRTDRVDRILCEAAFRIFEHGYQTADDIATVLVATYVGMLSTRMNAASSGSVH